MIELPPERVVITGLDLKTYTEYYPMIKRELITEESKKDLRVYLTGLLSFNQVEETEELPFITQENIVDFILNGDFQNEWMRLNIYRPFKQEITKKLFLKVLFNERVDGDLETQRLSTQLRHAVFEYLINDKFIQQRWVTRKARLKNLEKEGLKNE